MRYLISNVLRASPTIHVRESIVIENGIVYTCNITDDFDGIAINGSNLVMVPSFANAHLHLGETIFRGKCDGLNLDSYLDISHSFFKDNTNTNEEESLHSLTGYITLFEALRNGTGCVGCSRGHNEISSLGMLALCGLPFIRIEKLKTYTENFSDVFEKYFQTCYSGVKTGIFIQGLKTVMPEDLLLVKEIQDKYKNIRIMIHLSETMEDVEFCINKYGARPVQYINKLGLLNEYCLCVHLTHVNEEEMQLISDSNANVVFCPAAILKLRSGIPPIDKFYRNKIPFSLATDGLAVSGSASMLEQAKLASLISGGLIPVEFLLKSITEIPFKALGFENKGRIIEGDKANLALFEYAPTALFPSSNIISHLIHNFTMFRCKYLWIEGKLVISDGSIVEYDENEILMRCIKTLSQFSN
jgi:5-methylthioadenosine/S-adenosylhomocysteine deaminase